MTYTKVPHETLPYWDCVSRELKAKEGKDLETLVNDTDVDVLIAVAEQGYMLGTLVKSHFWRVRKAVAKQGKFLDILILDESMYVRKEALIQSGLL